MRFDVILILFSWVCGVRDSVEGEKMMFNLLLINFLPPPPQQTTTTVFQICSLLQFLFVSSVFFILLLFFIQFNSLFCADHCPSIVCGVLWTHEFFVYRCIILFSSYYFTCASKFNSNVLINDIWWRLLLLLLFLFIWFNNEIGSILNYMF